MANENVIAQRIINLIGDYELKTVARYNDDGLLDSIDADNMADELDDAVDLNYDAGDLRDQLNNKLNLF